MKPEDAGIDSDRLRSSLLVLVLQKMGGTATITKDDITTLGNNGPYGIAFLATAEGGVVLSLERVEVLPKNVTKGPWGRN
jgi:hypothetical protein